MTTASVILGLVAGNFLYQRLNRKDYEEACSRSFFQIIAIVCYLVAHAF